MALSHSPSIVTDGLVLCLDAANRKSYPGTGLTASNLIGQPNNLSFLNGITFSSANGGSFIFDGTDDYATSSSNPITGSNPFTLVGWLKTDTVSKYSGALSLGISSSGQSTYIGTVTTAQLGTNNSIGGGFYGYNIGTGNANLNTWVMVSLSYSGGASGFINMYINESNTNSGTYNTTPNIGGTIINIGRIGTDTAYDFDGSLAVCFVYARVLSSQEISQNFNALRGRFGI